MLTVQIVLFDGFDLLDAIAPYEVFCSAATMSNNALNVQLVTAEGPRSVISGVQGLPIEASSKLDPDRAGIILVPGAAGEVEGDGPDSIPAILGRAANTELTDLLKQAFEQTDITVATVCGGSLLLAMGGLLEGRHSVTHHMGMDVLGATGALPVKARVVDDGGLVTGGGVTSGLDVALHLVERELGPRIAHAVEQLFEYERRGTVWRAQGMAPDPIKTSSVDETSLSPSTEAVNSTSGPLHNPSVQQESAFDGEWNVTITTPVGKMDVKLSIATTHGVVHGTATQGEETVKFLNPVIQGSKLTWSQQVTKPLRLNLKFEVNVNGDELNGVAKAGVLPASKVVGKRLKSSFQQ
ncbi:DJ-1/PfpI family protein [Paenibacillus sp. XY044]|uniref:DJ-1/PfpI family protein n=1 Tax=Paenibacillus sp. XY044 TaxID=2026089 RepID=UPI000B996667|nr:DJ-1/PfpI family protein [Paenibacillus sp. XY044]OZB98856.1 thiamine biosynthesis protein ThiJ [Paenibacillus sp. XY044]